MSSRLDRKKTVNIAFLQPIIPHYREFLFENLMKTINIDLYIYGKRNSNKLNVKKLPAWNLLKVFIIYSFFPLLSRKYKILVLPGEIRSISTWLLLLSKWMHRKKIVLWGHGLSVRKYLKEEKKYPVSKKVFHSFANEIWVYTDKEKEILQQALQRKTIVSLNNTINSQNITILDDQKEIFKKKYKIKTEVNFIYCARFTKVQRRNDLLIEFIKKVDAQKFGFIIIGDGPLKPDFEPFENVYDFGAIFSRKTKDELFAIADMYIQMGWVGLSVTEALLYGKPVLTLRRSESVNQCVEYFYLIHNYNGFVASDVDELVQFVNNISNEELVKLQQNARKYSQENLKIEYMINKIKTRLEALNES